MHRLARALLPPILDAGQPDRDGLIHDGTGRTCATCHDAEAGWSVTPELAQARFRMDGLDDPPSDILAFYGGRFGIVFTGTQREDLVAFLEAL